MRKVLLFVGLTVAVLLLGGLFEGCVTTREHLVVRTDTVYQSKVEKDSVWLKDSVLIRERGDTVLVDRWHVQYKEKLRTDTVYIAKHDTISQTIVKTDVKEKEKKLTWWEKVRLHLANILLWLLLIVAVVFGVKWLIMKVVRP